MTKAIYKCVSVCLLLLIFIQLLPCSPALAVPEVYYGEAYNDLQTEQQRVAYRILEECIAGISPKAQFKGVVDIYYSELLDIVRAVCVDHPQYFWFLETGTYTFDPLGERDLIASYEPQYILDSKEITAGSQELSDAMYAFHTKVRQIVDGIPINCTTEYEIALYLHDYLAQNVTYTLEGDHPSAYAALVHGEAACYGYSKAYQCLLNAAGIRARTITGESDNGNGKLIGHAWNQVWLEGNCYYTDVTWDDSDQFVSHAYFAVSLDRISKDHFADEEFILPGCNHERMDYYAIEHGPGVALVNSGSTAAQIAGSFRPERSDEDNSIAFVCEIRYTGDRFLSWLDKNGWDICKLLGLSNATSIYYYYQNDVYYLQLIDPNYKLKEPAVSAITLLQESVTLPGVGSQFWLRSQIQTDSIWTPDLVYESSDKSVAIVDDRGIVTSVSEGAAVITVCSADGRVSACCSITVMAPQEHVHTMRHFVRRESTCTQDGHEAYYLCTDCGRRFGDENGSVEYSQTADYVLPSAHTGLLYIDQSGYHVQRCKCGVTLSQTRGKHTDADADGKCDVCMLSVKVTNQNKPLTPGEKTESKWITPVVIAAVILTGIVLFVLIRKRRRGY